jgi:cytochrome c biogenesis protein CcmG, thiol:disulfide interchange protein DsbE
MNSAPSAVPQPVKTRSSKKSKHKLWSLVLLISSLLLIGLLAKGLMLNPTLVPSTFIDKPALSFQVKPLQGASWIKQSDPAKFTLSDLKGHPVILNFWASWCVSCREEARFFEEFWQRYRESGLIVLGIAIQDTDESALQFAKTYGKTYPLGLDVDGKASLDYGVTGVPETFFIDRNGVVKYKEAGPMSVAMLEAKLNLIK